jgi:hypothetical protein
LDGPWKVSSGGAKNQLKYSISSIIAYVQASGDGSFKIIGHVLVCLQIINIKYKRTREIFLTLK